MKLFVPKLEQLSAIKIVTSLANRHDFRTALANFRFYFSGPLDEDWNAVETKMIDDVSELFLPEMLKQRVNNLIRPILYEILKWREYHLKWCQRDLNLPNEICWTLHGSINKKGTAERLIQEGNLSIIDRYQLACFYCLETHIMALWKILPDEYKSQIYDLIGSSSDIYKTFIVFWNGVKKRERHSAFGMELDVAPFQKLFREAIICSNLSAAEFLFQKLTPAEKESTLSSRAVNCMLSDCLAYTLTGKLPAAVAYFFLMHMDKEQQTTMFMGSTFSVLLSFIVWPWQGLFMEVANCLWNYLPEEYFPIICMIISSLVDDGFKDYDYQTLFTEVWLQSLEGHKKCVLSSAEDFVSVLGSLFVINVDNYERNIRLVLRDATVVNLQEIIFNCEHVINSRSHEHRCETPKEQEHWMRFIELLKLIYKEKMKRVYSNPSEHMCVEKDQNE